MKEKLLQLKIPLIHTQSSLITMANLREMVGDQDRIASHIMGAGRTEETPLFFTSQHGVVSLGLSSSSMAPDTSTVEVVDTTARISDSLNCSISAKGLQDLIMSESLTDQLKAAFL